MANPLFSLRSPFIAKHPLPQPDPARPRVLVICGELGGGYSADGMECHVVDALQAMGCATECVGTAVGKQWLGRIGNRVLLRLAGQFLQEPERVSERSLFEIVDRFVPTLVLVILGNQLSPKTVSKLRTRTTAPIVCWCQDQMTTLGRQYLLGAGYDAVFVKDRYMRELFSRMVRSTLFYYLAEACNPRVHRTLELTDEDERRYGCEVAIAGTLYYYRQEILKQLREFDLKIWGNAPSWLRNELGDRYMGRTVVLDDKVRAARAAKVSLNTLHFAEIDGLNCRAFELAGCGAFQLVTARPVLAEHFAPGIEIMDFDSIDDLIDKIRYYLKNPHEAAKIAQAGQLRAHREHTYEARLGEIFGIALGQVV